MPGPLSARVTADRLAWVDAMLAEIRALPLDDAAAFMADRRNLWSAESCLRRALEALFDLGRHILAKGFGEANTEYKRTALRLGELGVLAPDVAARLQVLAGYRNRMVHFYHELTADELYEVCSRHLTDVDAVADALRAWLAGRQGRMSGQL